ncbi:glycosyltransferase family 8 protein [Lepidopterella palustris CBS 459.81]|uniref:Glycosyltransferase family 8 protein n=1 Tax=Lepidopterella palustris CBS 459.81 TaxID=1314670 RepID=A0A8E2ECI0_9PEZI|nr:glycosyltransferase family 8 protein [Lepidopterella palustris CBS 459.81]
MPTGKRSDDHPRYGKPHGEGPFKWPLRRSRTLAIIGLIILYLIYHTSRRPSPFGNAYNPGNVDWSQFAYSLYATDSATVCHAVLVFEALERLGSRADRVLFYPEYWDTVVESAIDRDSQLLIVARDQYHVKLHPVKLLSVEGLRTPKQPKQTWDYSVTKFLAFGLTQYDRILHLDSDITLLQHLDDLFFLPSTPIAMPRAYWTDHRPWPLTSLLMLLEPSTVELDAFKASIKAGASATNSNAQKYDMDLLNDRFADSALVLPHRPYALLTGEFRSHNHSAYMGNDRGEWDPDRILKEAKLIHFSDWPLPKPWIMWPSEGLAEMQPDCGGSRQGTCRERVIWKSLYDDFRQRRRDICKLLSVPAPDWAAIVGKEKVANQTQ